MTKHEEGLSRSARAVFCVAALFAAFCFGAYWQANVNPKVITVEAPAPNDVTPATSAPAVPFTSTTEPQP